MVSSHKRDGDTEESGAARKYIFVVMLVPEHLVDATDSGNDTRPRHRAHPYSADTDAPVLRGIGLQPNGAELVPATRAKQVEPNRDCADDRHYQGEISSRAVEIRIEIGETRQEAGVNFR